MGKEAGFQAGSDKPDRATALKPSMEKAKVKPRTEILKIKRGRLSVELRISGED
ncbi:hypothetical protein [Ferrovibrio terrae]|uniref:hypothetical protein n=1 Tax=Ferrovibrio terrae TaxID=2594003 RepID=UPI0031379879